MGLIAAHWMLPLFSMTLPPNTLHRLWDLYSPTIVSSLRPFRWPQK